MSTFKKTLGLAVAAVMAASTGAWAKMITLNGAGATFPYPIYSKWFDLYNRVHPDIQINYQSIGSGGGIRQITARTVDFGATDGPMTDEQQFAVDGKILHFPTVLGAVVAVYNIPGFVGKVTLSGPVLADIFLGKVKSWDDSSIAALNPGMNIPSAPIVVVHRSDGSGTSYCFTDYLSKVSADWKKKVGKNTSVNWPVGLGGKGNEGVAGMVKQTPYSIGYVELIYAKQNAIAYASMKNSSGKVVDASIETVTAAAASAKMPKDYRVSITDSAGDNAYPISTFTWLLIYQKTGGERAATLRNFLTWMLDEGQKQASELGYAPLPDSVVSMERETIKTIQ